MRLALWSLAAIIAIGVVVVFVAPLLISAEDVRNRLFAEIEEATGYRLTVNGSLHISAFPTLKLVAEDVGVAQAKGAGAVDLATAKEFRFGLAVAPLLSGKVQLTEVALISPILTMPEASPKAAVAEPSEKAGGGASIATALRNLSLDSLRIEDGTLVLRGEGGAPGKRIDGLNLEASLPAFDAPLSVDLKARFDGQPLGVTGSISSFGPFLDGEATQLLLDVDAPAYFPQKLALMGSATYTGDVLALDGLSARAGETMLRGAVSADLSGAVPQIKASLNGDSLNVDGLLGGSAKVPAGPADGASGWSDAKIDFSGLKSVNAQVNLSVERLSYGTIKAGPIGIRAAVAGGKLKLELPNFQLYGGVGTGVLSVDVTGKVPVQALPLLAFQSRRLSLPRRRGRLSAHRRQGGHRHRSRRERHKPACDGFGARRHRKLRIQRRRHSRHQCRQDGAQPRLRDLVGLAIWRGRKDRLRLARRKLQDRARQGPNERSPSERSARAHGRHRHHRPSGADDQFSRRPAGGGEPRGPGRQEGP